MGKTRIISDIHLGSDCCQAKSVCEFLDNIHHECSRLILNGDIHDSMDFRRLTKHHWNILSQLRKISDKMEVIWVAGNHDGPAEIISHLLGIEVVDEFSFESGFKKFLVLHGHIFDNFIDDHPIVTWFCDTIYRFLQKIDNSHYIARLAKHSSKQYLRCTENIKRKAMEHATDYDVVCCGHSHHAQLDKTSKLWYANSGCWTEKPCTYLEIFDGEIELKEFTNI